MRIITCASYYGSGSSALTDLIAEYNSVKDLSNFEFRFLHDLDGVVDLEYHLVENHNRHNSGHALKRFRRLSLFNEGNILNRRYSKFFDGEDYHNITGDYISSLIDFKYQGWWFYDLYDKGNKQYYLYQVLNHLFSRIPIDSLRILKNEETLCSHPTEEEFLAKTRRYVSRLMKALNKEGKEYLEIDQIMPSSNMEKVMRYFDDELFVFVVDRDPRDIFILGKYYWKDGICPKDPELFCKWYKYARTSGRGVPTGNPHIVKLQFEDFVYRYDSVEKVIEDTTGLQHIDHTNRFKKMNPLRSVNNTRLWEKHQDSGLAYIENELRDYLYDYSAIDVNSVKGIKVNADTPF